MPLYTFKNKETGELKDMMLSISAMEELKAQGEWAQHFASAPGLISQSGSTISRTSGDWKDHLKRIKKSSGHKVKNTVNI